MINKFQQGGATLQGSILLLIQQLPEDLQKQIMQAFTKWALQKGVDINQLQKNPQALETALGEFIQEMQLASQGQQTLAARHGAKLNYLKSLKNQCPDGYELYYYKKGGMVKCGCTGRKLEDGGKAKKENAVDKFKKQQNGGTFGKAVGKFAKAVTKSAKRAINETKKEQRKESEWKVSGKNTSKNSDYAEYDKCGSKIKKHLKGTTKGGMTYTKEKNPDSLYETFATQPDEFGRQIKITRGIYPRNNSFNNDTLYWGSIYRNGALLSSTNNYMDNGKILMINSLADHTTPGSVLGLNQYKNWGDYFEYLLKSRKFFNPLSRYIDNK